MVSLGDDIRKVVGGKSAPTLIKQLGLRTVGDLLRHYPRRYDKRGELTDFTGLLPGLEATIQAEVTKAKGRWIRPKLHKLDVEIVDGHGRQMTLTFFNSPWRAPKLQPGVAAFFAGVVESFKGTLRMTNPVVELDDGEGSDIAGQLVPIYSATKGFATWQVRRAVHAALGIADLDDDPLPAEVRLRHGLADQKSAFWAIHRPDSFADVERARRRLKWDEAFALQTVLAQRRAAAAATPAKPRPARPGGLLDAFDERLPFTLTAGQLEVSSVILGELAQAHPMHRLLHGEVGSGKTVVALRAMLAVIDAGGQAALLAPTEVLAQQHFRSINVLLGPLAQAGQLGGADIATHVVLITGSTSAAARRTALAEVASGAAGIVIGTHALIEEGVEFADLGLVVVDEQHRFGVEQREALRAKGADPPHVLVMTATPIPRTVAMTVYGDLEVSALTELPSGRQPIQTHVVPARERPKWLERAWERLAEQVAAGHQAYVVCPRIGGDDADDDADHDESSDAELDLDDSGPRRATAAVLDWYPKLAAGPCKDMRVEMLHGRMHPDDKERVMRRFAAGDIDVLVSTTVIEVGVDVPNATVMVVLDADRYGVSQLHQLRGRVGRGDAPGLCFLVTECAADSPAQARLVKISELNDGFELSQLDLEQRREGDVLDKVQAGRRSSLRLLSVLRDEELIRDAREAASDLVAADPGLGRHSGLRRAIDDMIDPDRATYLEKA